jgi:hypothetical protein
MSGRASGRSRALLALFFPLASCASSPPKMALPQAHCTPACQKDMSCGDLDGSLLAARAPLMECIGLEAKRGHLGSAHRCYRALRLLESARWWLKSLIAQEEMMAVYHPSESVRQEFLCRIEQLARARRPGEVERLYLDMIRSYP